MTFYVKQNDTSPSMLATLKNADGNAVDISGGTVRFHLRQVGADSALVDSAAVIVDGVGGIVRYDWLASDTVSVGSYQAEFEVTYSSGAIETFPNDGYISVKITGEIA